VTFSVADSIIHKSVDWAKKRSLPAHSKKNRSLYVGLRLCLNCAHL